MSQTRSSRISFVPSISNRIGAGIGRYPRTATCRSISNAGSISTGCGTIALRAHANGEYVCADNAGASPLIANRTAVGLWETFGLIHNADGSVSLQAKVNNHYVTAENAGASALIANRTAIGPWEEFDLIND